MADNYFEYGDARKIAKLYSALSEDIPWHSIHQGHKYEFPAGSPELQRITSEFNLFSIPYKLETDRITHAVYVCVVDEDLDPQYSMLKALIEDVELEED